MKILTSILFILLMCNSCQYKKEVDLIIRNAKIYTVNANFSVVQAAAINDGKFVALGSESLIKSQFSASEEIDLQGKFMYPGFIDPHCHFYGYGQTLSEVDLRGTLSFEEVVEKTKKHHAQFNTEWVSGRGWDQNDWENQAFPDKALLDIAFPDTPVLLRRIDGHAAIANTVALNKAGITSTSSIEGGLFLSEKGSLTGILIDKAVDVVLQMIPEASDEAKVSALLQAQQNCFSVGITSVGDAGLGYANIQLIDSMQKGHTLQMRIYAMLEPTPLNINNYLKKGTYKTDYLHVRSLKLYADGALGSRGACLLEPYADDSQNRGLLLESAEHLKAMCELAYTHNYQVNTHCIGDSANRIVLDIYAGILKQKNDLRWRIEHAQIVHSADVEKYGAYSVIPSIQTTHCTSDMYWAPDRLGPDRIKDAYIWKDLLKENGWLPNGSDFPIEDINPLFGFYAAVTRKDQKEYPENGFQPDQKLSRMQALRAMTIWAAKAQFEELEKGSLEPGKFADFVVTSKDIMSEPESELFKIPIEFTYSNGKRVYENTP